MGHLNVKSNLMVVDKYANMRCQMFFTDCFVMFSYCRKFVRQTFCWFAWRGQYPDVLCRKNRILGYFFDRWKISLCCEECRLKMPLIVQSHVSPWFRAMYIALFPLIYPTIYEHMPFQYPVFSAGCQFAGFSAVIGCGFLHCVNFSGSHFGVSVQFIHSRICKTFAGRKP